MDTNQPMWAKPIIGTAGYVVTGDRVLHEDDYYEVLKREISGGVMIFHLSRDGGTVDHKAIFANNESVAYQKRLE